MEKEYTVVSPAQAVAEESAFVEDFWTKRWENKEGLAKWQIVYRREEYKVIEPFLSGFAAGSRILDGGCGLGAWTVLLADRGFAVTGLDISQRTVARLKKLLPRYAFACGDIRHTGFPDAYFDAYLSWGTFEHFESGLEECINEAHRILKPGGFLFVSVPFQSWWRTLRQTRRWQKKNRPTNLSKEDCSEHRFYQWRLTRLEMREQLELRGFRVLEIKPINKRHGVTCWMQESLSWLKASVLFSLVRRILVTIMPASYISHMILVIGQKMDRERHSV